MDINDFAIARRLDIKVLERLEKAGLTQELKSFLVQDYAPVSDEIQAFIQSLDSAKKKHDEKAKTTQRNLNGFNFTERVRRTLVKAREQASLLRHEYVGTEHILLGLLAEGEGKGVHILETFGLLPADIEHKVMQSVKLGKEGTLTGPDLPYTSRAKKILELSMAQACDLDHTYVGTEHLLLGIIAEGKGIASHVLVEMSGKTCDELLEFARTEIRRMLDENPPRAS